MMLIRQLQQNKWHFSPHSLFTKDSVMKPYWKSHIREGEGGWLLFHLIQFMCFTLEGKGYCVMRRLPGLEGGLSSLSFLAPGLESVSCPSPWLLISQGIVSQAPADGLPTMLRARESPFLCQRCLPAMPGFRFSQSGTF